MNCRKTIHNKTGWTGLLRKTKGFALPDVSKENVEILAFLLAISPFTQNSSINALNENSGECNSPL
jgi:hypothetical protein